jgi:hypothetical protein
VLCLCNVGFIGIQQPTVELFRRNYFFSSTFFFGVGFGEFGGGGQLPFLSFVTQLTSGFFSSFFAGSAANVIEANANITTVTNAFI